MRRTHYLSRNHKVELPQHLIFVDTETKPTQISETEEHHYLWFGWAAHVRCRTKDIPPEKLWSWTRFETAESFWCWVFERAYAKTRLWIYAHNWNFDAGILGVSKWFLEYGWTLQLYINNKPPFILDFIKDGKTIRLCDTLNYFAGSLASIGESIKVPKLSFPSANEDMETWNAYCKHDVRVTALALLSFRKLISEYDLGNFQSTLASQAFTAYRHKYMHTDILIHDHETVSKMERVGYYGGRVECFQLGTVEGPLYYLDFNSMYPYVMKVNDFPIKFKRLIIQANLAQLHEALDEYAVVADVTLNTLENTFPTRHDHRLVFPIGEFRTVLNTPELAYALERGYISSVHRFAFYEKANIFADFVDDMYQLRQQFGESDNPTYRYMIKILMNSLYGKFGQNGQKWKEIGPAIETFEGIQLYQETPEHPVVKRRIRLGMLQELSRNGESENSFPAIAAHVTAYGRLLLWDKIQKAGVENVFYIDTDSLIVSETGYQKLQHDLSQSRLGALKRETMVSRAHFFGPKDYRLDSVNKHKGIRHNAKQLAENRWEQDQFVSWDFQIGKGYEHYIPIKRIRKTLHRVYRKGRVESSGRVQPLLFST